MVFSDQLNWYQRLMLRSFAALLFAAATLAAQDDLDVQMRTFINAFAAAGANAADPIDTDQVFYSGAIPRLLSRLDPHSVFFDPDQFEQLRQMETSTQKGFGSVVSILPGRVIVLQALPGTPSPKPGFSPGDEILAINGYEIGRLDLEQLTQIARSLAPAAGATGRPPPRPRGLLALYPHPGGNAIAQRGPRFLPGAGIGYIRVASFEEKTGAATQGGHRKTGRRPPGGPGPRPPQQSRRVW